MPRLGARLTFFLLLTVFFSRHTSGQEPPKTGEAALLEAENQVATRKKGAAWISSKPVLPLAVGDGVQTGELSRAAVRLTDLSVLRMNEFTTIEILPREKLTASEGVNIKNGAIYLLSRDRPEELRIQTPVVTGALRGTEFHVAVEADGKTRVTMFDGEVELSNRHGRVLIRSGEQGEVVRGQAPKKTAVIEAVNIIQWCLYYPAVLNPAELGLSDSERHAVRASLSAYQQGDLLGALEKYPTDHQPASVAGRLYHAAVLLAVGQVDKAQAELESISSRSRGAAALKQMIAAVKFQDWSTDRASQTAGEWLAQSYYLQSKAHLEDARAAARHATEVAPDFGYAWVRLAELEFSFGRTSQALEALDHGLQLTPRNPQGYSLKGFLLSAQNRIGPSREQFEQAMQIDGALGNAWLGRGLTFIRQGKGELGRRDLQTAAVLEPNRAIFHSYLGKAFSEIGNVPDANRELKRAIEIDPNDPTPWLYSAIEKKQENRYNEAIDDLEKSIELNDNRRVYRSKFLLDQDRSIRGTNLAAIYQDDGMIEQSVREAVRAVDDDYSSAPAHLFLANSYNALRDPDRILLRYETAWFNELLLSNLLSPVGGGPLSQFVSEQEYSKMFEHDGFGASSVTEYFSYGEVREIASQYGTFGNISYSLDTEYQYADGIRPNNWISRSETYGEAKVQITPQDTAFFQTKFEDLSNGDVFQHYNQTDIDRTFNFHEMQDPALLLLGFHHEWSPENHTLVLLGRLENEQTLTTRRATEAIITRDISPFTTGLGVLLNIPPQDFNDPFSNPVIEQHLLPFLGRGQIDATSTAPFTLDYQPDFVAYTAEVQQILTIGPNTIIAGGRYQNGEFDTRDLLVSKVVTPLIDRPAANQDFSVDLERINIYAYDIWRVLPWLSVTGGLTFDHLDYPQNFRSVPVNDQQQTLERVSPKVGFILTPAPGTVIRGAYTQAISGASFDESIRLEPTQVAGFTQAYRTIASEDLIGSVAGSRYEFWGISAEQRLKTRTYLGAEFDVLKQKLDRTLGVFDALFSTDFPSEVLPSSLEAKDNYREDVVTATVNQLVGENFSLGARYRFIRSHFRENYPEIAQDALTAPTAAARKQLARASELSRESRLHELNLFALFNHPSGFFARAEANWYKQENEFFAGSILDEPGDNFWQINLIAGWRFYRNQCEISAGVLDLNDADYRLDPLNPYLELPRSRTFALRAKLSF
jgi:tetratricopeptide (TPR) repeat protein